MTVSQQAIPDLDDAPSPPRPVRGFWALGDQAVLSAGNFFTNVLLARAMLKDEFGDYTVVLSFVLFLNTLHASLVTYPLSVTSAAVDEAVHLRQTAVSLLMTLALAIPFAAMIAIATGRIHLLGVAPFVALALLLWQLQETLRRAMMARLQHRRAIPGDAISYLGQAVLVFLLTRHGGISIRRAFEIIAITSAAAALVQFIQLQLMDHTRQATANDHRAHVVEQARSHWHLGRWILLGSVVSLLTIYATPWTLRYFHGSSEVAMYAVLLTILGASNPILQSMTGLIVPAVALARRQGGLRLARHAAIRYALMGAAILVPVYAVLLLFPGWVLGVFYKKNSSYVTLTYPLRLFVLTYAMYYCAQVLAAFLNGLGLSRSGFKVQLTAAVATALIALPLAARFGLNGAVWGGMLAIVAQLFVAIWLLRGVVRPNPIAAGEVNSWA